MAKGLIRSKRPPLGTLVISSRDNNNNQSRPTSCPACHCNWGYIDSDAPASLDPLIARTENLASSNTFHIHCGLCGRELS